jgi:histone deacetylase complex regulatory component SIN3
MKYLIFFGIALVLFVYNTFKIDPYTNQVVFTLYSEVAPKSIVKATSVYGYGEAVVKGGSSLYCIKNIYDSLDIIADKPYRYSKVYEQREKDQNQKIDKSCALAKNINGVK